MEPPVIYIFVRHSADCKYRDDPTWKRCDCRKWLRYTIPGPDGSKGKQYRKKTGSRSWAGAELKKRELADQLAGKKPDAPAEGKLLEQAIETFQANKSAQGVKPRVLAMYARELKRLRDFSEAKGMFTVKQALTLDNLVGLRATWTPVYKSSYSRATVQKHLNNFLKFAYNAGWIDRVPKLSPIKIDAPETEPLADTEYDKILQAATGRTRTIIKLMRWSGLAIRDASTIRRSDFHFDKETGIHKIIRERTKTRTPLFIPVPADVAEECLAVANGNPEYVFWNPLKDPTHARAYRIAGYMGEQVAAAFKAAGVYSEGHMISHRLRATFAVDLLQKGVPLEHVSKLLGHRSVTTTERHYARWIRGRQVLLENIVSSTWKK